jgi:hypothetical protein
MQTQLKGLIYYLLCPFVPYIVFKKLRDDEDKNAPYFLAILLAVAIAILLTIVINNSPVYVPYKTAFYIGIAIGIILKFTQ